MGFQRNEGFHSNRRQGGSREVFSGKTTTIFVDNLPFQIRKIWVYNLFSKFGKIRNLFIPHKRSRITGQSFAFVRFLRCEDAAAAISKTNDSWYWNQKLVVKFPRFLKEEDIQDPQWSPFRNISNKSEPWLQKTPYNQVLSLNQKTNQQKQNPQFQPFRGKEIQQQSKTHMKKWQQNQQYFTEEKRGKEIWRRKGIIETSKQGEQRNVQIYETRTDVHMGSIKAQAVGNGWLIRSAIAKMKRLVSTKDLEYVFRREENIKVQIKAMGGRYIIITFSDSECRDATIKEKWLTNWFEEVRPWKGEQAMEERFVWLACYGMPLNAWSNPTFKEIGEKWGQFMKTDEDTLKEFSYVKARILVVTNHIQKLQGCVDLIVDGIKYPVRVTEEDSFRIITQNLIDAPLESFMEKKSGPAEEDDMAEHKDEVDNLDDVGSKYGAQGNLISNDLENSNNKMGMPSAINEVASSSLGMENSVVGNEKVADSFEKISKESQSQNNKLNCLLNQDSELMMEAGIEKETVNDEVDKDVEPIQEELDCNTSDEHIDLFEANHIPIQATIKGIKGKRNRKSLNEILGFSKVNKSEIKGKRNQKKCVVLRSAVASAALSASISSGEINNRNRILLDEAQAIWAVDKLFGITYNGDENEVISKIAEMEALNKARADNDQ